MNGNRTQLLVTALVLMIFISSALLILDIVSKINAGQRAVVCILAIDIAERKAAVDHCLEVNGLGT